MRIKPLKRSLKQNDEDGGIRNLIMIFEKQREVSAPLIQKQIKIKIGHMF